MGITGITGMIAKSDDLTDLDAVTKVTKFLFSPAKHVERDQDKAIAVLMNSAGMGIVRHVFGPPFEYSSKKGSGVIDYGWIAEAVIFSVYGRIPDLREVVNCVNREPKD